MPYKNKETEKIGRARNRHKKLAYMKNYHFANRDKKNAAAKQWYYENKERATAQQKRRNELSPEKHKAYHRDYCKRRCAEDIEFQIKNRLRCRLYNKLRTDGIEKSVSAFDLTGCTTEFLRGYIEARFKPGMNWNNIHIDHIIPLCSFVLTDPDQQRKAFHYTNLQPLFGIDNMRKGRKIPQTHQGELL